jgi:hypothetical protein
MRNGRCESAILGVDGVQRGSAVQEGYTVQQSRDPEMYSERRESGDKYTTKCSITNFVDEYESTCELPSRLSSRGTATISRHQLRIRHHPPVRRSTCAACVSVNAKTEEDNLKHRSRYVTKLEHDCVRVYDLPSIAAAASAPTSVASGSLILSGGISGIIPAAGVVHTTEGVVSATEAVVAAISGWSVASPGGVAH